MTTDHDAGGGAVGDRGLLEEAAARLLAQVPAGWARVHAEFEPSAMPPVATATATTPAGEHTPVEVSADVTGVVAEHQRRAAAAGTPWRRLVIDCDADGSLSAHTEPRSVGTGVTPAAPAPGNRRRWPVGVLAAVTVGCLTAAAIVFATGWRWGPPPRMGMIEVPAPPPRQQEAFAVVSRWYAAQNRDDVAGMRAVACADPAQSVLDWISTIQYYGPDQALIYPDAVTKFRVEQPGIWVQVAVRIHPVDERSKREVEAAQHFGGFFFEELTLVDEFGELKVCDMYVPPN